MNSPQIVLVNGYHAVTPVPEQCHKLSLHFRFAVLLQTFEPDYDYERLQMQLILGILKEFININNNLTFTITHENELKFTSFEKYEQYLNLCNSDDMPFSFQIEIKRSDLIFCLMVPELWALVGGPDPYCDSYAFSFYTGENMTDQFTAICEIVCSKLGMNIAKRINGESSRILTPASISLRRRILNFFIKGVYK